MQRWILCVLCPQITHSIQNVILHLLSVLAGGKERGWRGWCLGKLLECLDSGSFLSLKTVGIPQLKATVE